VRELNKRHICGMVADAAKKQGGKAPHLVQGLMGGQAKVMRGLSEPWIYFDHSYFNRGWHNGNFRACRDNAHITQILDRPTDRLEKFNVKILPWRKTGERIILIPPSPYQRDFYDDEDWVGRTLRRLAEITDRTVYVKSDKTKPMRDVLHDAWAVVTRASVAGMDAALAGVPVFSTPDCCSWGVNAGPLEKIETPDYSDARLEWASSLAYASWNRSELQSVKWADYNYEVLCAS